MDSQLIVSKRLGAICGTENESPVTNPSDVSITFKSIEGDPLSRIISLVSRDEPTGYECAAGMSFSDDCHRLPLCPLGANAPGPGYSGITQYRLSLEASKLWGVPLTWLRNVKGIGIVLPGSAHDTSIGAMVAAAHGAHHSCLSFAVNMVTGVRIPHEFQSLSASTSLVRWLRTRCDAGDMVFARLIVVIDGITDVHVLPLCTTSRGRFTYRFDTVSDYLELYVYDQLPDACGEVESAVITCGVSDGPHGCCPSAPSTGHVCEYCNKFVNSAGHMSRCRRVDACFESPVKDVLYRRAQLGDCYHKTDVTVALMHRRVPDKKRTHQVSLWINGAAQASYMKSLGKTGDVKMLATWFEAVYPALRRSYLTRVFPDVPFTAYVPVPEFEQLGEVNDVFFWNQPVDNCPSGWREVYAHVVMDSVSVVIARSLMVNYQSGGPVKWAADLDAAKQMLRAHVAVANNEVVTAIRSKIYVLEKVKRSLTFLGVWSE